MLRVVFICTNMYGRTICDKRSVVPTQGTGSGRAAGNHGAGRNQLFPDRIHLEVEPFERVCSQQHQVTRLREYHEIGRLGGGRAHQRVADFPLQTPDAVSAPSSAANAG